MDWSKIGLLCGLVFIGGHQRFVRAQSFDIVPHEPHPQQHTSGEGWRTSSSGDSSSSSEDSSMWPYPTYRPISWEKYYANEVHDKHISLTSGLAAGITIGVFFAVFLLTFGCRLYSQRSETLRRLSSRSTQSRNLNQRRLSVSDFFSCSSIPPPPAYDIAIRMPNHVESPPPAFTPLPPESYGTARPV